MAARQTLFASFIQAGFECSTHRYGDRRLDLLAQTRHDAFASQDFALLKRLGIRTIRTGARWHRIEERPSVYDFGSLDVILRAAEESGMELILDLFHFGWPDHLDIGDSNFPGHFGRFVHALIDHLRRCGTNACGTFSVMNEMSFLSWVGGDVGNVFPHWIGEGQRMKAILVQAAAVGSEILLNEWPGVRLTSPEPVIHIIGDPKVSGDEADAENYRLAQYDAWDMLSGRLHPELGGRPEYLDIIGVNFYDRNQWVHNRETLRRSDPRYRPFRQILREVWERYQRPLFVSETGTEDEGRPDWFRYVCDEVEAARDEGIPVEGICLYPILNHPDGWTIATVTTGFSITPMRMASGISSGRSPMKFYGNRRNCSFAVVHDMTFTNLDLICLSHLRWNFVLQRPQHLMSRFASRRRVFFFEEPIWEDGQPHLNRSVCPKTQVHVVTPVLPFGLSPQQITSFQRELLTTLLVDDKITDYIAWYYTPTAMEFTSVLDPVLTIYDCMDELTAFAGAPPLMKQNEAALFQQADLVFTGGASLFASKRQQHRAVYQFPSSIDTKHFNKALSGTTDPADQAAIPHPRLGYAGVIDERMDLDLLTRVAKERPDWHFVLLGPVVKIDPAAVPKLSNIHLLGMKNYADLPQYLAGWDVGLLPFALNDATKYISPTKTPEYLAAGLVVISTAIRDVVSPYGELGLVKIVNSPHEFIAAAEELLTTPKTPEFRNRVDRFLAQSSWDSTALAMEQLMKDSFEMKHRTEEKMSLASGLLKQTSGETH